MLSCVSLRADSFASTASSVYAISIQFLEELRAGEWCQRDARVSQCCVYCEGFLALTAYYRLGLTQQKPEVSVD